MSIIRYRGPSILDDMRKELDALWNNAPLTPASRGSEAGTSSQISDSHWSPVVDVREEEGQYLVYADVPGMKGNDIDVSIDDNQRLLVIRGERQHDAQETDKGYLRIERSYGNFYRAFTLPERVDANAVKAKVEHGVLLITLPKASQETTRKVNVE